MEATGTLELLQKIAPRTYGGWSMPLCPDTWEVLLVSWGPGAEGRWLSLLLRFGIHTGVPFFSNVLFGHMPKREVFDSELLR